MNVLWVSIFLAWLPNTFSVSVEQTPRAVTKETGASLTISCVFRDVSSHCSMIGVYWYRQRPGQTDCQYLSVGGRYTESFNEMTKSSSLTITTLTAEDTGTYYCCAGKSALIGRCPATGLCVLSGRCVSRDTYDYAGSGTTLTVNPVRPPKLIPLVPSPEFIHNQTTAVLGCVISGFSPDDITVSWKKAGSTQTGIVLPSTSTTDGGFETVTYLRVPVQEWISKLEYTCEVTQTSAGFREKVNMRYQDGGPCPSCCSECVPMFLYQTDLNATFSDGSTQHYHCLEGKCEIK